jgi:hypothetical protein
MAVTHESGLVDPGCRGVDHLVPVNISAGAVDEAVVR